MAEVSLEHLSKTYATERGDNIQALDDVSLTIADGEWLVLAGPSASGKTTLLRLLAGLDGPSSGSIRLDGRSINGLPPKELDVAMVFQSPALYPHLNVFENIAFGLRIRHVPKGELHQRVTNAAEMLGLTDCLARQPIALSGGQRQRVALARALVRRPGLLLLDEPLSSLDAPLRAELRLELRRLHQRFAWTVVYVTHDQTEALTLGDRVAVLHRGRLEQAGTPDVLYRRPVNLFVAGFLGSPSMNLFEGVLAKVGSELVFQPESKTSDQALEFPQLKVPSSRASRLASHIGKKVVLGLRPEHIRPMAATAENLQGQEVRAPVELVQCVGAETLLHLRLGELTFIARGAGLLVLKTGDWIRCVLDMAEAHFFDPISGQALE